MNYDKEIENRLHTAFALIRSAQVYLEEAFNILQHKKVEGLQENKKGTDGDIG